MISHPFLCVRHPRGDRKRVRPRLRCHVAMPRHDVPCLSSLFRFRCLDAGGSIEALAGGWVEADCGSGAKGHFAREKPLHTQVARHIASFVCTRPGRHSTFLTAWSHRGPLRPIYPMTHSRADRPPCTCCTTTTTPTYITNITANKNTPTRRVRTEIYSCIVLQQVGRHLGPNKRQHSAPAKAPCGCSPLASTSNIFCSLPTLLDL